MTLAGKINMGVARTCFLALAGGLVSWGAADSNRTKLRAEAPNVNGVEVAQYNGLEKMRNSIDKVWDGRSEYVYTGGLDRLSEEAAEELSYSLHKCDFRRDHLKRASEIVSADMKRVKGSPEYRAAQAEWDEINDIIDPLEKIGIKYTVFGGIGILLSGIAAFCIELNKI